MSYKYFKKMLAENPRKLEYALDLSYLVLSIRLFQEALAF
jgi:hypothetical protein